MRSNMLCRQYKASGGSFVRVSVSQHFADPLCTGMGKLRGKGGLRRSSHGGGGVKHHNKRIAN
jgi:hypothetical protein